MGATAGPSGKFGYGEGGVYGFRCPKAVSVASAGGSSRAETPAGDMSMGKAFLEMTAWMISNFIM